jgi:predicted ATP-dependent endonuclease of OLD family
MILKSLKIDGFKSLVNTSLSNTSSLNMLYGYNNSGKSNILKIIDLVFRSKRQSDSGYVNFYTGYVENSGFFYNLNKGNESIPFEFKFQLEKTELKGVINASYLKEFEAIYYKGNNHTYIQLNIYGEIRKINFDLSEIQLIKVDVNNLSLFKKDDPNEYLTEAVTQGAKAGLTENGYDIFQSVMNIFNDCFLFLDNDRYFVNESIGLVNYKDLNPRNLKQWLYTLSMNPETYKLYVDLLAFVNQFKVTLALNDELTNCENNSPLPKGKMSFGQNQGELFAMFESNNKRLPLSSFGTGIQQIFYILSKIFSSEAKIILIEEIELNLSPKYQAELLKHLKKLISTNTIAQMFFTSHSKYFSYRNDEFSIYEVTINSSGETVATKRKSPRAAFFSTAELV